MILSTCIWGERTTQEVITLSRDAMSECDLEVFKSEDRNVSRASDFERFSCAFLGISSGMYPLMFYWLFRCT